jgi:hypothetical protein
LSYFAVLNKNGELREFYRRIWKVSENFKTTGMKMGMWRWGTNTPLQQWKRSCTRNACKVGTDILTGAHNQTGFIVKILWRGIIYFRYSLAQFINICF